MVVGLTATADTTAGTGHHLYGVEFQLALANLIQQFAGVAQTMRNANANGRAVEIDRSHTHPFHAAQSLKFHLIQFLFGKEFVGRAGGGFNHTAGNTEDNSRTRGFAQGLVEVFFGQIGEVDVGLLDEIGQLAGGNGNIHIGHAVGLKLVALTFVFLGQTRHNRHHHQVFALHPDFFGKISLGHRPEHLLRRLGRRGHVQHIGIVIFKEVDPSGAARRQDGQLNRFVALHKGRETTQEFGAFFHNG